MNILETAEWVDFILCEIDVNKAVVKKRTRANCDIHNITNEFHRHNCEQKKPDTKEYTQYESIYMKFKN